MPRARVTAFAGLTSERQNDLTIARLGDQRFEIPDVVVFGD